jgi:hypothetical protein
MSLRRLGSLPKARLPHRAAAAITLRMPERRARVSLLYRSKRWLTLAQLVPTWARELANPTTSASELEGQLWHYLLEDILNGRFDDKVLGLAFIQRDNRPVQIQGRLLIGKLNLPLGRYSHRILVSKEAVLDLAQRQELPPPSWWADKSRASKENAADVRLATPAVAAAPKRRKGPEPGSVDRFGDSDEALFPEIDRIRRESRKSVHAATLELAFAGRIEGTGSEASRAKRLAGRYRKARRLLAETG